MRTYTGLLRAIRFRAKGFFGIHDGDNGANGATASQEKLPGFEQERLTRALIHVIGCGGIGGMVVPSLVRKGAGVVHLYDGDDVEDGNLGRQFFTRDDVGKNKAECLGRNVLPHASKAADIIAHPVWFQDAAERDGIGPADVALVLPDNDPTRVFAARFFLKRCGVVFVGIGPLAEHGYVFVQRPGEACFGCLFPDATRKERYPCPGTPAMIDILMVTAGLVLTAVDSLLMKGRPIQWNYWDIYPSGMVPTAPITIKRRDDCPICGSKASPANTEAKAS
jgi:molybdopterin/thiamine biosynthesis adenylyltransferase